MALEPPWLSTVGQRHRSLPFAQAVPVRLPVKFALPNHSHDGRVEMWRGKGWSCLLPPLSSGGALVEPDSVSTSRSSNRTCRSPASGSRTRLHAFAHATSCARALRRTSEVPVEVARVDIPPCVADACCATTDATAGGVVVERPVRGADGSYLEVVRPARNERFNVPTSSVVSVPVPAVGQLMDLFDHAPNALL